MPLFLKWSLKYPPLGGVFVLGKRIVALSLCFVIIFSLVPAASAEDYINRPVGFWDYMQRVSTNASLEVPFLGQLVVGLDGLFDGKVCGVSGDAYHHTDSIKGATLGEDSHGQYANATCKYCAQPFKIYSSDLSAAYDDYVDDVKTQIGTATLIDGGIRYYFLPTLFINGVILSEQVSGQVSYGSGNASAGLEIGLKYGTGIKSPFLATYRIGWDYQLIGNLDLYPGISDFYGTTGSVSKDAFVSFPVTNGYHGKALVFKASAAGPFSFKTSAYVDLFPYTGAAGDYYDIDISNSTRPTVIIGDVGYYDASNNLQVLNNTTIVNETNNTFFNPITNITMNVTNWAYDYSNRSYNLTLDTGDKVSVTYGDENITIIQGGTTYNVYYIYNTPGGGEEPVDPETPGFFAWWKKEWEDFRSWLATALRLGSGSNCEHTYTSAVERESACTEPGLRTYTCTKCGHTYTELIDALGHDWTVTGHVDEVLDEVGNVVEKGYDKLTCSRCDAESKDYGEGPVESDIFDALGDLIADGITWILDKLTELADSLHGITDVFTSFVEKVQTMPGEYPLFFAAFVAIIPEDLSTVLWFSVISFVVFAVWKKWSA